MKQLIPTAPSTNTLLQQMIADGTLDPNDPKNNLFTLYTYRQTAGRGQQGNSWESQPNKNLTFSTLFQLNKISIQQQFLLSQLVPVAICNTLRQQLISTPIPPDTIKIKWPNDIYWNDRKLSGILIEHSIIDNQIHHSIAGVGININQTQFLSDAPNPVSLKQITGNTYNLEQLLDNILQQFNTLIPLLQQPEQLKQLYMDNLYRAQGYFTYRTADQIFEARIIDIADNGLITLQQHNGITRQFAFKQLTYII